jgi:hypothetical protein
VTNDIPDLSNQKKFTKSTIMARTKQYARKVPKRPKPAKVVENTPDTDDSKSAPSSRKGTPDQAAIVSPVAKRKSKKSPHGKETIYVVMKDRTRSHQINWHEDEGGGETSTSTQVIAVYSAIKDVN